MDTPDALPCPSLPRLPPRAAASHKGSFGTAVLIGGSRGMAGAIALAGMATSRSGAGLVRLAIADRCLETVAGFSACYMTLPLPDDPRGRIACRANEVAPWLENASCVAIGPGLGQSQQLQQLLHELLPELKCPLVLDADGLNNLCAIPGWQDLLPPRTVLTPHPGEWSRLSGVSAGSRLEQESAAIEFARNHSIVIVLKGQHTCVTDGATAVKNATGTPALATGGSGDVLTGVITALVCQGLSPRDAAHLGVHVHGLAGELAERRIGGHVVLPTELIDSLPAAFAAP